MFKKYPLIYMYKYLFAHFLFTLPQETRRLIRNIANKIIINI